MRRLTSITVIGLACLLSLPVYAQRGMGGGGRSMGGGGGFRGGGGFHSSAPMGGARGFGPSRSFAPSGAFAPRSFAAPRTFSAPRSFAPRSFAGARTFAGSRTFAGTRTFTTTRSGVAVHTTSGAFVPFRSSGSFGVVHFHNGFFFPHNHVFFFHHNVFFHNGCFGCFSPFFFNTGFFVGAPFFNFGFAGGPFVGPVGYPYYGYPYPYGYPSDSSDYYAPAPAPAASSDNGGNNDAELSASIQQLSDEVADLRSENRELANREANSNSSISAKEPGLPAVFIFKDGRRVTAQNYAIAGETLWIMDEHSAHKFALSELDATATEHANAINGVDVRIPAAKP